MDIEITDVRIFKIKQKRALIGFANVLLNNCFAIRGIRIIETEKKGKFIAMPSRLTRNHKFRDMCFPINQDTRDVLTVAILDAYNSQENTND